MEEADKFIQIQGVLAHCKRNVHNFYENPRFSDCLYLNRVI